MRQNVFTSITGLLLLALMTCSCGNSSSVLFASEESKNAKLQDDLPLKKIEFSVSCMICHNNGPRAIRARSTDPNAPLSFKDRFKIALWNVRIKAYGRIHYDSSHDSEDKKLKTPFRHRTPEAIQELKVATCLYCHKEKGFLARGTLQRQQIATSESLVSRGEMPPWGLKLSKKEQQELQDFLHGF